MLSKLLGDDLIEARNPFDNRRQLSGFGQNGQTECIDDSRVIGQGTSRLDLGEALLNQGQISAVVLKIELL